MSAIDEAAKIVNREWKSSGKWFKVLIGVVIGVGLLLLLGYLFSKFIRLLMPARVNNWRLYLPRVRRV